MFYLTTHSAHFIYGYMASGEQREVILQTRITPTWMVYTDLYFEKQNKNNNNNNKQTNKKTPLKTQT